VVSDKSSLINELSKYPVGRKYVLDTYDINAQHVMRNPGVLAKYKHLFIVSNMQQKMYILKPVSGFAGANIDIITSYTDLVSQMTSHIKRWGKVWKSGSNYYKEWVLQEYLADPLLFGETPSASEYKFHVRHYFIFRPGNKKSFFLKRGLIATGIKPYVQGDWGNKDIHDTHFHGRIGPSFPSALNLPPTVEKKILAQLYELYSVINKILKKTATCYAEARNCFELFGADLMLTKDYKIKILELNSSPGLAYEDQEYVQDEKKAVIENIMSIIVDDYFPPKNKAVNDFIKDVVFIK
jgi:hypothetical protein